MGIYSFKLLIVVQVFILYASASNAKTPFDYKTEAENAFLQGNTIGVFKPISSMIEEYPTHPVSVLSYHDFLSFVDIMGFDAVKKKIGPILKKIENENPKALLSFLLEWEKILYSYDIDQAKYLTARLSPIRNWTLHGPFHFYGLADINVPFAPERSITRKSDRAKGHPIRIERADGALDPCFYTYPENGVIYAITRFLADGPVKIIIESTGPYKAFINGAESCVNEYKTFQKIRVIRVSGTKLVELMIKACGNPIPVFRVLTTDDKHTPVKIKYTNRDSRFEQSSAIEEMPYPHDQISNLKAGIHKNSLLGDYFSLLKSSKAVNYYASAEKERSSSINKYYLARSFIDESGNNVTSALYGKGVEIMRELSEGQTPCVPAEHFFFRKDIEQGNYDTALLNGGKLLVAGGFYLPLLCDYLTLLDRLGYDSEFLQKLKSFSSNFHETYFFDIQALGFYRRRDIDKSINLCETVLKKRYSKKILNLLVRQLIKEGSSDRTVKLIKKYQGIEDISKLEALAMISNGDNLRLRSMLMKNLSKRNLPWLYYQLGRFDLIEDSDPGIYWSKAIALDPSLFSLSEHIDFLNKGSLDSAADFFRKKKFNPGGISRLSAYQSEIISRRRFFILNIDGSSRIYCEDVVLIAGEDGIGKWGEIKIPYRGKLTAINLSIHQQDGSVSNIYRSHAVNRDTYLSAASLKKGSIIHLEYIVDNPVAVLRGSRLFSFSMEPMQNFDEPVRSLSVDVIAPGESKINFHLPPVCQLTEKRDGEHVLYSFSMSGMPAVSHEKFSGSEFNSLPYYAFSSINGIDDLLKWYKGLTNDCEIPVNPELTGLRKKQNIIENTKNTYDFVAEKISLLGNIIFYPERTDDVFYRKSGSPEDKALLAKSILESLGIKSYIAVAKDRFQPGTGSIITLQTFSHILLYIPISKDDGIFLDFSGRYHQFGEISPGLIGTKALILAKKSYHCKIINSRISPLLRGDYEIVLNADNKCRIGAKQIYNGSYSQMKKYFKNRTYIEENIHSHFASIVPAFSLDDYSINNNESNSGALEISANGSGFGMSAVTKDSIYIEPVLNKSSVYRYIQYPARKSVLIIQPEIREQENYIWILPEKFTETIFQKESALQTRFGKASIQMNKDKDSRKLFIRKSIAVNSGLISPNDYAEFIKFCLEIQKMENSSCLIKLD